LRGRASATARTVVWSALPAGLLAGGALGGHIGLAATMLAGAALTALASLVVRVHSAGWWSCYAAAPQTMPAAPLTHASTVGNVCGPYPMWPPGKKRAAFGAP
jgi:hypothetical protein